MHPRTTVLSELSRNRHRRPFLRRYNISTRNLCYSQREAPSGADYPLLLSYHISGEAVKYVVMSPTCYLAHLHGRHRTHTSVWVAVLLLRTYSTCTHTCTYLTHFQLAQRVTIDTGTPSSLLEFTSGGFLLRFDGLWCHLTTHRFSRRF